MRRRSSECCSAGTTLSVRLTLSGSGIAQWMPSRICEARGFLLLPRLLLGFCAARRCAVRSARSRSMSGVGGLPTYGGLHGPNSNAARCSRSACARSFRCTSNHGTTGSFVMVPLSSNGVRRTRQVHQDASGTLRLHLALLFTGGLEVSATRGYEGRGFQALPRESTDPVKLYSSGSMDFQIKPPAAALINLAS